MCLSIKDLVEIVMIIQNHYTMNLIKSTVVFHATFSIQLYLSHHSRSAPDVVIPLNTTPGMI